MRAGTLSKKDVIQKLKRDFVCAWTNIEGNANAGGSFAHPPSDPAPSCSHGNGEHNVQMLFLTPDRKLLHTVAGYVAAPDLLHELKFVKDLWALVQRAQTESARKHLVVGAHDRALRDLGKRKIHSAFAAMTGGEDPMAAFTARRLRGDHTFVRNHPLLPADKYRSEDHVGAGSSWFGSSSGGRPTDSIGTPMRRPRVRGAGQGGSGPGATARAVEITPELLERLLGENAPQALKDLLERLPSGR